MSRGLVDARLLHGLAGSLDDAPDAGLADEHVVRLLGEHEAASPRQRIEARLGEAFELHLAVAVGEEGEHEEREPVRRRLVEGAQHARLVGVAGATLQQALRFLTAIAPEIFLQQVDHGPQVPPFLDIDLEQVAHVVERRRGLAEVALLLDGGRFGVALDDDQPAEHRAIFAGHVLPDLLPLVAAEADLAIILAGGEQDAPAVFGHSHVVEFCPALGIDADRRAQVHVRRLEAFGPHGHPPVDVSGMPLFQGLQHALIVAKTDIVRNLGGIVDLDRFGHVAFLFLLLTRRGHCR